MSPEAMFYSAAACNASAITHDHTGLSNSAENLAWTGGDPYYLWYTLEKNLVEQGVTDIQRVGHYKNLLSEDIKYTGGATNGYTWEQSFDSYGWYGRSPEEYLALLDEYEAGWAAEAKSKKDAVTNAQNELAAAQSEANTLRQEIAQLESQADTIPVRQQQIRDEIAKQDALINSLSQTIAENDRQIAALNVKISEADKTIQSLNQQIAQKQREVDELTRQIDAIDPYKPDPYHQKCIEQLNELKMKLDTKLEKLKEIEPLLKTK